MKSRSLQSKLFFAYISLACLILFSFAVFFYAFVSRQLKQSQISAMNTLNSSFQTQVDSAIRNLDAVSVNINYSNQSKTILDNSFNLNISSNMLSAMSDLFISLSGTELKADQVNLYDFSGYVLEAGISTIVKKTDGSKDEWIEGARELEGKKVLTPPYCTREYTKTATYDQWFISLYRSFNNQYKRGVGVIETAKQCKSVFKSIITYKKKNHEDAASIYVFDSNGDLIYPYDISQEYKAALQPYYELTKGDDSALTFISPLTGKTEYAAEAVSSYTGYTYLTIQPESVVLAPVYNLLRILAAIVALFLTISIFISYRLSRSVVKPVKHLKHIIQRMELDTLGQEKVTAYPVSVNELEELYQAFQLMSDNLKDSMEQLNQAKEQEMKARSMALQTQINPHFLYNTLDSIYCVAIIHGDDQIAEMILALSNNFKLSLNNGEKYISVADSIRRIEEYMKLQNMRYQDRFELHIEVQPEIMVNKIISFILQPFVENAMYHGLEPKLGKGSIWVTGKRAGKNLVFEIRDDGVGIQDLSKLETGYGIRNVKERIQLNYGPEYGVTFESEPGKGTTVRITIPEKVKGMEKHVSISGD